MGDEEFKGLVLLTTLIFLIAPAFITLYIFTYNQRKKKFIDEKAQMKLTFESELTKSQLEIQEQTLQTIGANLHDNIGQLLSLTSLTLKSISPSLLTDSQGELESAESTGLREKISSAIEINSMAIQEMRQLGKLFQGDHLIFLGLDKAIRHQIDWMEKSGKYTIHYSYSMGNNKTINCDKDLILFRVVQEIMNNIIKHSHAKEVSICLGFTDQCAMLQIKDDGVGFDLQKQDAGKLGSGIQNIKKRVEMIHGNVVFDSGDGTGTCIDVYLPYP